MTDDAKALTRWTLFILAVLGFLTYIATADAKPHQSLGKDYRQITLACGG